MRILFVYPNVTRVHRAQLGLCSIAAVARQLNHECDLYDLTTCDEGEEITAFESKLASFAPDLLAVSCRSNEWSFVDRLFHTVDVGNTLKVFGGPHTTVAPEEVLEIADVAVIGEGEQVFSELLKTIARKGDISSTLGCWVKQGSRIIKNELPNLISDLDKLPIPYWGLFDDVHHYQSSLRGIVEGAEVIGSFEATRGCPYNCAYCTNNYLKTLYAGKGNWRREKSPERIIHEIQLFRDKYGLDAVGWVDEIMLTGVDRLERFRDLYRSEIGVPFVFMERPENMTGKKASIIKQAGARAVSIGIESGDDNLRKNLLNRRHSQQTITSAFRVAKEHGLTTHAFTMIGFPGENRHSIRETFKLLKEAKPDTVQATTFYPLRGTKLYEIVISQGLFSPETPMPNGYYGESPLDFPKSKQKELLRCQYLLVNFNSASLWLFDLAQRSESIYLLFRLYRFPQEVFSVIRRMLRQEGLLGLSKTVYSKFREEKLLGLFKATYNAIRA